MMNENEILELAGTEGFRAALTVPQNVPVNGKFRVYCEENRCGKYGANYSCPPDCGPVESLHQKLLAEDRVLVVQTIWDIAGYKDKETVQHAKMEHNKAVLRLLAKMKEKGLTGFCSGYNGCPLCDPCRRVLNQPCLHPEQRISCMSAYCIDVQRLAEDCGMEFAWAEDKLYLFGIIAFHEENSRSCCSGKVEQVWNVDPVRTALMIIDMEKAFVEPEGGHCIAMAKATVLACNRAAEEARAAGIPVFWVKRIYRQDGSDVEFTRYPVWDAAGRPLGPDSTGANSIEEPEGLVRRPEDYVIIKPRWSAFFQTELDLILRRKHIDTVILTGTTTPNCVRTTCYDAIALDYKTVILEQCCSSNTQEIQQANMEDMERVGAVIVRDWPEPSKKAAGGGGCISESAESMQ